MNKTILTIILTLSFFATLGAGQAVAAFGDCLSWIWGGRNESTTYSPPYSPTDRSISGSNQSGGQVVSPPVLGQSAGSATPVYVTSPSYTDVRPDEYSPPLSYSAMKPAAPAVSQPAMELRPVVKKEWTYSPITSVRYKPVQHIDPQSSGSATGQVSTYYRAEESKTLLPWLHRKETIEYKPVLVSPQPLAAPASVPAPATSPQIVQANYAAPQPHIPATPIVYVPAYSYVDPCGNLVFQGAVPAPLQGGLPGSLQSSEPVPVQMVGDLLLNQSPNASSTASTFVSQNSGGHDVNYGIPPIRPGYEPGTSRAYSQTHSGTTPASEADRVPVLQQRVQRTELGPQPMSVPLISEEEIRPVHPFAETFEKPEAGVKSLSLIKTPVPDLPTIRSSRKETAQTGSTEPAGDQKLLSPTQVYKKYQSVEGN